MGTFRARRLRHLHVFGPHCGRIELLLKSIPKAAAITVFVAGLVVVTALFVGLQESQPGDEISSSKNRPTTAAQSIRDATEACDDWIVFRKGWLETPAGADLAPELRDKAVHMSELANKAAGSDSRYEDLAAAVRQFRAAWNDETPSKDELIAAVQGIDGECAAIA